MADWKLENGIILSTDRYRRESPMTGNEAERKVEDWFSLSRNENALKEIVRELGLSPTDRNAARAEVRRAISSGKISAYPPQASGGSGGGGGGSAGPSAPAIPKRSPYEPEPAMKDPYQMHVRVIDDETLEPLAGVEVTYEVKGDAEPVTKRTDDSGRLPVVVSGPFTCEVSTVVGNRCELRAIKKV